jgi:hypothetical protein
MKRSAGSRTRLIPVFFLQHPYSHSISAMFSVRMTSVFFVLVGFLCPISAASCVSFGATACHPASVLLACNNL